jgi:hypothetical protein
VTNVGEGLGNSGDCVIRDVDIGVILGVWTRDTESVFSASRVAIMIAAETEVASAAAWEAFVCVISSSNPSPQARDTRVRINITQYIRVFLLNLLLRSESLLNPDIIFFPFLKKFLSLNKEFYFGQDEISFVFIIGRGP